MICALYFINEMDRILINFEARNLDSINEPVGLANLHILLINLSIFNVYNYLNLRDTYIFKYIYI